MTTYRVVIITRDLEKYTYLIDAEDVGTAKRRALGKLYNSYEARIPYKTVVVEKIEDLWVPMG